MKLRFKRDFSVNDQSNAYITRLNGEISVRDLKHFIQ